MDVLDADKLVPAMTTASEAFDLDRVSLQQASRGRPQRCDPSLASVTVSKSSEDGHGGGVGAGHLHRQCPLDLIPGLGGLNHGQCRVDRGLGKSTSGQAGSGLKLKEAGVDEVAGGGSEGVLELDHQSLASPSGG